MKKVLALLLSATLAVGCVAGCLTGCSDMTFDDDIYNDESAADALMVIREGAYGMEYLPSIPSRPVLDPVTLGGPYGYEMGNTG